MITEIYTVNARFFQDQKYGWVVSHTYRALADGGMKRHTAFYQTNGEEAARRLVFALGGDSRTPLPLPPDECKEEV